jgi:hypothetical protein
MTLQQTAALARFAAAFAFYLHADFTDNPNEGLRCGLRLARAEQALLDDAIEPELIDAVKQAASAAKH